MDERFHKRTMRLYHGSNVIVTEPDPDYQLKKKAWYPTEYGFGFYTTDDFSIACEHVENKIRTLPGHNHAFVSEYTLNLELARKELNIKQFDWNIDWLEFVIANVKGRQPSHYDIVIGPLADDETKTIVEELEKGTYTKTEIMEKLKEKYIQNYQIVFMSGRFDSKSLKQYLVFESFEEINK